MRAAPLDAGAPPPAAPLLPPPGRLVAAPDAAACRGLAEPALAAPPSLPIAAAVGESGSAAEAESPAVDPGDAIDSAFVGAAPSSAAGAHPCCAAPGAASCCSRIVMSPAAMPSASAASSPPKAVCRRAGMDLRPRLLTKRRGGGAAPASALPPSELAGDAAWEWRWEPPKCIFAPPGAGMVIEVPGVRSAGAARRARCERLPEGTVLKPGPGATKSPSPSSPAPSAGRDRLRAGLALRRAVAAAAGTARAGFAGARFLGSWLCVGQ